MAGSSLLLSLAALAVLLVGLASLAPPRPRSADWRPRGSADWRPRGSAYWRPPGIAGYSDQPAPRPPLVPPPPLGFPHLPVAVPDAAGREPPPGQDGVVAPGHGGTMGSGAVSGRLGFGFVGSVVIGAPRRRSGHISDRRRGRSRYGGPGREDGGVDPDMETA
ncbi:hypothetical protein NL676_039211 [Syzygium grande]|nr:hypothetical protein NL676_039211 [Syzygium grande]